jgi:hypothetical protein
MMIIVIVAVLVILVLVGGVVALVAVIARSQRQKIAADNEVMPGMPTRAPASWAGSHDPEARLHRRLRDAMAGLRAVNAYATTAGVTLRAGLEQAALGLDDHLVAVAALAPAHRQRHLSSVTAAVEAVEAGVAQYATAATAVDMAALEADLASVQSRLDTIATIRQGLGRV